VSVLLKILNIQQSFLSPLLGKKEYRNPRAKKQLIKKLN